MKSVLRLLSILIKRKRLWLCRTYVRKGWPVCLLSEHLRVLKENWNWIAFENWTRHLMTSEIRIYICCCWIEFGERWKAHIWPLRIMSFIGRNVGKQYYFRDWKLPITSELSQYTCSISNDLLCERKRTLYLFYFSPMIPFECYNFIFNYVNGNNNRIIICLRYNWQLKFRCYFVGAIEYYATETFRDDIFHKNYY